MSPVSIVALVFVVWAALDLLIVFAPGWLRGRAAEPAVQELPDEAAWLWPQPPWDARSIESTLAEIRQL